MNVVSVGVQRNMDSSNNLLPYFTIIAAYEQTSRGIGYQNRIPWHVPADMNFFRKTTIRTHEPYKKNVVIMGRKTWESLEKKPLDKRINICLTSSMKKKEIRQEDPDADVRRTEALGDDAENAMEASQSNMFFAYSMDDALQHIQNNISNIESVFVIGGSQIYQEALRHAQCDTILINELIFEPNISPSTDSFFPEIPENMYQEINLTENPIQLTRDTSVKINPRKFIRKHI